MQALRLMRLNAVTYKQFRSNSRRIMLSFLWAVNVLSASALVFVNNVLLASFKFILDMIPSCLRTNYDPANNTMRKKDDTVLFGGVEMFLSVSRLWGKVD